MVKITIVNHFIVNKALLYSWVFWFCFEFLQNKHWCGSVVVFYSSLTVFCVFSGLWMPSLLEGPIVLCCWGGHEGLCVRSQVCSNLEKVRLYCILISSPTDISSSHLKSCILVWSILLFILLYEIDMTLQVSFIFSRQVEV